MSPLAARLAGMGIPVPALHIVLGSGFGASMNILKLGKEWQDCGSLPFTALPSIPAATVAGHSGMWRYFKHAPTGKTICFQVGRVHGYEGHAPQIAVLPVMEALMAGTRDFVLTNAAGGMDKKFRPGDAMLISDHVNLTGQNPLQGRNPVGHDGKPLGPRFPDMSNTWDKALTAQLKSCLQKHKVRTQSGIYLGLMGPSYETPAEVALFARWGLHAVGMSTVWEAIALRHGGAKLCGLSLISNMAAGIAKHELTHGEVEETGKRAASGILLGLFDYAALRLTKATPQEKKNAGGKKAKSKKR